MFLSRSSARAHARSCIASALAAATISFLLSGCPGRNPDFCCVTEETCAAAGLTDERRPCEAGQACKSYECVAADCRSSADCTSPEAPACRDGLCTAGCAAADDCAGIAGRSRCDARDATCVGCLSSGDCPAERALCDAETRSCRGCSSDDECASGVCIEATGVCAADSAIIYVTETGVDAGTCPKAAPCRTMAFAMGLTSSGKNVIRLLGSYFYLGNSTVSLSNSIVIDGTNTTLTAGAFPVIYVYGTATVEGVRLELTDASKPLVEVDAGGVLSLFQAVIANGQVQVRAGAALDAVKINSLGNRVECEGGGRLSVRRSDLQQAHINSWCSLVLAQNRIKPEPPSFFPPMAFAGPEQVVENNVFIGMDANSLLIAIGGAGSKFRFNTIVNSSPLVGAGRAVVCDDGLDVTSNIIAYNSTDPISCVARYSLFDAAGAQVVGRGVGNVSADIAAFFRDRQGGDFHLSANSPARGIGEPGLVATDLDGNARPMPAGSMPDVGAYEAP